MRMNHDEIKSDILDHWEQIANEDSDLLIQLSESAVPVYNNDIIKDWQEMPSEFDNAWQEFYEPNGDTTIVHLMTLDLYEYYRQTYQEIYLEIVDEKESEQD